MRYHSNQPVLRLLSARRLSLCFLSFSWQQDTALGNARLDSQNSLGFNVKMKIPSTSKFRAFGFKNLTLFVTLLLPVLLMPACQPPPQRVDAGEFSGKVFSMPNPMADRHSAKMISSHAADGEYVKYMRDFPADLIRVEALLNGKAPTSEFLDQTYFPKFIRAGVPNAELMDSGEVQTSLGPASYLQVRMKENGSGSKGTSGIRVDGIRTVMAINVGNTLLIVSRQRDEEGFDGAFSEKRLDPSEQLAGLVEIANTIKVSDGL
jgi:hypothetical protein